MWLQILFLLFLPLCVNANVVDLCAKECAMSPVLESVVVNGREISSWDIQANKPKNDLQEHITKYMRHIRLTTLEADNSKWHAFGQYRKQFVEIKLWQSGHDARGRITVSTPLKRHRSTYQQEIDRLVPPNSRILTSIDHRLVQEGITKVLINKRSLNGNYRYVVNAMKREGWVKLSHGETDTAIVEQYQKGYLIAEVSLVDMRNITSQKATWIQLHVTETI